MKWQEGEGDPVRPDLCDDLIPPGEVTDSAEPVETVTDGGGGSPPTRWRNLIRLEGDPVECPFPGEFTFKYAKGKVKDDWESDDADKQIIFICKKLRDSHMAISAVRRQSTAPASSCDFPLSKMRSCITPTEVLFQFQDCDAAAMAGGGATKGRIEDEFTYKIHATFLVSFFCFLRTPPPSIADVIYMGAFFVTSTFSLRLPSNPIW